MNGGGQLFERDNGVVLQNVFVEFVELVYGLGRNEK